MDDEAELAVSVVRLCGWWQVNRPTPREEEIRAWLAENSIPHRWDGTIDGQVVFDTIEDATYARLRWGLP